MSHKLGPGVTLILGGARSGKSRFAEALAEDASGAGGLETVYIATGQSLDEEMAARIAAHQARRDAAWRTVEAPFDLAGTLTGEDGDKRVLLVDCLTLWVSNLMLMKADIAREIGELVKTLSGLKAPTLVVSNEVGLGIVPDNAMAREYRDHAGHLNQRVAEIARNVYFIAAGLPMVLKQAGEDN